MCPMSRGFWIKVFFACVWYTAESETPFVTRSWPPWKRAMFFNRFNDWLLGLLMNRARHRLLK